MKLLALDSSGLVASVAILDGETLVAEYTLNYKKTHSQTLLPMLDEIVKMTQTELSEMDAIAVAAGPGSFTGLRIGSATAKGLGLALNKPIISVPTLEGIACNFYGIDAIICPMMDARRKQVYTGIYRFADHALVTVSRQKAIAVEELQKIGVEAAVRIGSCGALQPEVRVGDLVMVEAAVRDEGTSLGYAPLSYPAVADHRLLTACEESAKEAGCRFHTGIARSHDCLYRDDNPVIYEEWAKKGVLASDMETAALFVVGRIRGMRTASILNVVAACKGNVAENIGRYVDGETLTAQGEEYEILTAFAALTRQ
mgnify:CR=1 FL=1